MLELPHEANAAARVIRECVAALREATAVAPTPAAVKAPGGGGGRGVATRWVGDGQEAATALCAVVRRHVTELANAFDVFVAHTAADARRKGLSAAAGGLPPQRAQPLLAVPPPPPPPTVTTTAVAAARSTACGHGHHGAPRTARSDGLQERDRPAPPPPRVRELFAVGSDDGSCDARGGTSSSTLPPGVAQLGIPFHSGAAGGKPSGAAAVCVNLPGETPVAAVAAGCYVMFDVLMRRVEAAEGLFVLRVPGTEEAQAVCVFGGKQWRTPPSVRLSLHVGAIGASVRTGLAVNIAPEAPTEANPTALCMPVLPAAARGPPIGAVLALRKLGGSGVGRPATFTRADEEVVHQWTMLAAQLIASYNVDLLRYYYDPHRTLLHRDSPIREHLRRLRATDPLRALRAALSERGVADTIEACSGHYPAQLAAMVVARTTPQLILRCVHHNHFAAPRGSGGAHLTGAGVVALRTQGVADVAEYVAGMEECWKRAAEELQEVEHAQVAGMEDYRERKRQLKQCQRRIAQLEEECRRYKDKFEVLKLELSTLCGAPIDVEGDHGGGDGGTQPRGASLPSIAAPSPPRARHRTS